MLLVTECGGQGRLWTALHAGDSVSLSPNLASSAEARCGSSTLPDGYGRSATPASALEYVHWLAASCRRGSARLVGHPEVEIPAGLGTGVGLVSRCRRR